MTRTTDDPLLAILVQRALEADGFYTGPLDGSYGPATETAFQMHRAYARYELIDGWADTLSDRQSADLVLFLRVWTAQRALYERVGAAADVPAALVAAIHWRESDGSFSTYLHNGDPLGQPTVHEPKGILFHDWEPAAVDALKREKAAYALSGIEAWATNLECQCVFAEAYNGEGYADRGVPDPYVLAGTAGYRAGKFTADGVYDPAAVDRQIGVVPLLRAIRAAAAA